MTQTPVAAAISWGGVGFNAIRVPASLAQQSVPRIGTGSEVQRSGRQGVTPMRFDDFSAGLMSTSRIMNWERDKGRYWDSQGLMAHIPGILALPYVNTSQATFISVDASGYRAANKRGHAVMFEGQWIGFADTLMMRSTSTSDATLTVPGTADNVTEKVTAVAVGDVASVQSLVRAGSTTDDIEYTQDATGSTVTWTKFVTLTGTPYINWIKFFPQWNQWILSGRVTDALGKGLWHFGQADSLPITAPGPVVFRDGKDTPGSAADTTMASVDLAVVGYDNRGADIIMSGGANVTANAAAGDTTGEVIFGNGAFSAAVGYAKGRRITGIQLVVAHTESGTSDNLYCTAAIVRAGGSSSLSFSDGAELGTSGTDTYGGSSSTGGLQATTTDLAELTVSLGYVTLATAAEVAIGDLDVTDVDVTITYANDGTPVPANLGGFGISVPSAPDTVYEVTPVSDDLTAVTVQRVLKKNTFSFDSSANRPVADVAYPHTGIDYVGLLSSFQGGCAVLGGSNETTWNQCKLLTSDDQTIDLRMPQTIGTKAITATAAYAQGNVLIVDVAVTDGSDAVKLYYYDGRWHVGGVWQDSGSAISTEPILWAESALNSRVNFFYRLYPVSTTHLAGAREFLPSDLFADPFLTNTSQVKQNGALWIQSVILDGGPEEANKAIMSLQAQSLRIDDNTSHGSVRVYIEVGGDTTFASPAIDKTFDAAAERFADQNINSAFDPGTAYRTMIVRIALGHEAGSTESPNGLPILLSLSHQWPHLQQWAFDLIGDPKSPINQPQDLIYIGERLKAASDTKVANRLLGAGIDKPATLEGFDIEYAPRLGQMVPLASLIASAVVTFRQTAGSTS